MAINNTIPLDSPFRFPSGCKPLINPLKNRTDHVQPYTLSCFPPGVRNLNPSQPEDFFINYP